MRGLLKFGKEHWTRGQKVWAVVLTLLLTSCGILGKSLPPPWDLSSLYCKTQTGVGSSLLYWLGPLEADAKIQLEVQDLYCEWRLCKIKGRGSPVRRKSFWSQQRRGKGRKVDEKSFRRRYSSEKVLASTTGSSSAKNPVLPRTHEPLHHCLAQPLAGSCPGSTYLPPESWGRSWNWRLSANSTPLARFHLKGRSEPCTSVTRWYVKTFPILEL